MPPKNKAPLSIHYLLKQKPTGDLSPVGFLGKRDVYIVFRISIHISPFISNLNSIMISSFYNLYLHNFFLSV